MEQVLHTDKGVNPPLSLTLMCLWHVSVHVPSHAAQWGYEVVNGLFTGYTGLNTLSCCQT